MSFAIDDLDAILGHWSADQITGLSDGDPVGSIPDSINANHLGSSGTARPLYLAASALNSLPALDFQGGDDFANTGSAISVDASDVSFFVALRLDALGTYVPVTMSTASGPAVYGTAGMMLFPYLYSTGGGAVDMYGRNLANTTNRRNYTGSIAAVPATTAIVLGFVRSQFGWQIRVNGVGWLSGAGSTANAEGVSANNYFIGLGNAVGVSAVNGLIAEAVFAYETLLCESVYIEAMLAHKFGVTLPATHPFVAGAPASAPGSGGGGSFGGFPLSRLVN